MTLAFAAALIASARRSRAAFVYVRVADDLSGVIDDGLGTRADDLAALVGAEDGPRAERRPLRRAARRRFSQILDPAGEVVASTLEPRRAAPLLAPAKLQRAAAGRSGSTARGPGVEGKARILAGPAERGGRPRGRRGSLHRRPPETLAGLAGDVPGRRAGRPGARLAPRLPAGRALARAGRGDAPASGRR